MRVYLGSDHAGFELKQHLVNHLAKQGYDVVDVGPHVYDPEDAYPPFCLHTGAKLVADPDCRGIHTAGGNSPPGSSTPALSEAGAAAAGPAVAEPGKPGPDKPGADEPGPDKRGPGTPRPRSARPGRARPRSEEHTSELQSR